MNLYFTYEPRNTVKSLTLFITVETIAEINPEHSDKFDIKISKISRRGPRSPDDTEFGHFKSSFWRGRHRNVPTIITHVQNHCSVPVISIVISKWLLPELSIPAAGQKDRRLWGREWSLPWVVREWLLLSNVYWTPLSQNTVICKCLIHQLFASAFSFLSNRSYYPSALRRVQISISHGIFSLISRANSVPLRLLLSRIPCE